MKDKNITIEFTAIMDYLRDKDLEILELKNKNEKQSKIINKLKITLENENRNVYSLLKKKLLEILEEIE
jgi:transcriptional regulator